MKKEKKKKTKIWPIILAIIFIIILAVGAFLYFSLATSRHKKQELENPIISKKTNEIIIDESYITYILNEIGAYNLHNPPLSSETPKIEILVDDEKYNSEIINGKIITRKGEIENEDIKIITTKQEIIDSIVSLNTKNNIKDSVEQGTTEIEIVASNTKLFSKGYLNLYRELSGKSLTGSIIKIFTS